MLRRMTVALIVDERSVLMDSVKEVLTALGRRCGLQFSFYATYLVNTEAVHTVCETVKGSDLAIMELSSPALSLQLMQAMQTGIGVCHLFSISSLEPLLKINPAYAMPFLDCTVVTDFDSRPRTPAFYERMLATLRQYTAPRGAMYAYTSREGETEAQRVLRYCMQKSSSGLFCELRPSDILLRLGELNALLVDQTASYFVLELLQSVWYGKQILPYLVGNLCTSFVDGHLPPNPVGLCLAAAFYLEYGLHVPKAYMLLRTAVCRVWDAGLRTADLYEPGTTVVSAKEMAEAICEKLQKRL